MNEERNHYLELDKLECQLKLMKGQEIHIKLIHERLLERIEHTKTLLSKANKEE